MGRLKVKTTASITFTLFTFQFHYGTIKSIGSIYTVRVFIYFNSTMGRLKGKINSRKKEIRAFQFHYGTIKRQNRSQAKPLINHFNSTMGRLKDNI